MHDVQGVIFSAPGFYMLEYINLLVLIANAPQLAIHDTEYLKIVR